MLHGRIPLRPPARIGVLLKALGPGEESGGEPVTAERGDSRGQTPISGLIDRWHRHRPRVQEKPADATMTALREDKKIVPAEWIILSKLRKRARKWARGGYGRGRVRQRRLVMAQG